MYSTSALCIVVVAQKYSRLNDKHGLQLFIWFDVENILFSAHNVQQTAMFFDLAQINST